LLSIIELRDISDFDNLNLYGKSIRLSILYL
jgi:hypothetical protein